MVYDKTDLNFIPPLAEFHASRAGQPTTVFAGPNNSGKSLVLKWMKHMLGRDAYMVGANRFYHVYHFASALRDPNEIDQFESTFESNFWQEQYNYEQNFFDLNRIIIGLRDIDRGRLFELCGRLLGSTITLKKLDPENDLSMRYIDLDDQNLSVASTGARLLMTILGICMDERFRIVLIDEPELGLGPRVQQSLSDFLHDPEQRSHYFPNLQQVYLATHSHLFLARSDVTSNFVVTKSGLDIGLGQVQNIGEFHRLQFNLLGNSLEAMYLPSAIVVVEGKTDFLYLERLLELRFPGRRVTVVPSGGDVKRKVTGLRESLGDLQKSPFRDRTFVVLDSVHQPDLTEELTKMGILRENVVVWDRNGIEYLYPSSLLREVYGCSEDDLNLLEIDGDRVRIRDVEYTKAELADRILTRLHAAVPPPEELDEKLIARVAGAID